MSITIKIDTREQEPYSFTLPAETGTLSTGDYSIRGLEDLVSIERKTIDDLIGCLTRDRERFERELHKGKALDYFALVIEASLDDLVQGKYKSMMNPKSAIQSLIAFSIRYCLPVWFAGNRRQAQRLTESLLEKFANEIHKRFDLLISSIHGEHHEHARRA